MAVRYISLFTIFAAATVCSCKSPPEELPAQKPNIILIMADDLGWFDTGFNGNKEIRTPHMDRLASKGVIFDRFYSASAVCSPTRASFITGRNPLRMNIPNANSGHMKKEEITIPEILKAEGYTSGHFGKWHLGTLSRTMLDANRGGRPEYLADYTIPSEHGYDYFFCTESKVPTFDPLIYPIAFEEHESLRYGWKALENGDSGRAYGTAYWSGEDQKEEHNLQGDDSRIIMDRVIPFMENAYQQKQAFLTTIWFHTPHLPVVCDSIHRSYYAKLGLPEQLYYGSITAMDEQIGRLWDKIQELDIQENTIIFFCSDNGPERDTPGSAGVFRERKRSLYEGGVRVPAFVTWQDHLQGGKRIDFPAFTSDYLPTILEILELDYPSDRPLDGISILDALHGNVKHRNEPMGFIYRSKVSWVTDRFKLIGDTSMERMELYDLINDRAEEENLIEELPELAEQLKTELSDWLQSVDMSAVGQDY